MYCEEADPSTCVITTTIAQKRIQRGNHLNQVAKICSQNWGTVEQKGYTAHSSTSILHTWTVIFIRTSIRVHRQAIQRVHAYLSTSCTQRRLYNIHMHISYFEVQFCLPTNVECSYMCNIHRLYFMLLYTRYKMRVSTINFIHHEKIQTTINQKIGWSSWV